MKRRITTIIIALSCLVLNAQYNKSIKIEPVLKTDTTSLGQKIIYPQFNDNQVTILKITMPPGKSTGWHKQLIPVFAYVLEGTITVEFENKKSIVYLKNSTISESFNTYHNGVNRGNEDVVLLAFYMGEKGKPLSVPMDSLKLTK